jgi:ubiquinone/menaquinone biosynthesis C-methylase UbiE
LGGKTSTYLKKMRLWSNFFATSGAELQLLEKYQNLTDARVLEIGCGDGRLSLRLSRLAREVIAIDINQALIQFAGEYAQYNKLDNLHFLTMNGQALDFPDESFDLVVLPWMLHLAENRDQVIAEAKRVLKTEGTLAVFALYGNCDYDNIARNFVTTNDDAIAPESYYRAPLSKHFATIREHDLSEEGHDFSFIFPDLGVTLEAFLFAFKNWYDTDLSQAQVRQLRQIIEHYRLGNHIALKTKGKLYVCSKDSTNLELARRETRKYHEAYYSGHRLFEKGSWLAQADQDLMADLETILEARDKKREVTILDLGCGVGRNAIAMALLLKEKDVKQARIICLDLLAQSIDLLKKYAHEYGVSHLIKAEVKSIDYLNLPTQAYDLALAISCLEHCANKESIAHTLASLCKSLKVCGFLKIEMTTDRQVQDRESGEPVVTYVETALSSKEVEKLLNENLQSLKTQTLKHFPYKEELIKEGRKILWQSNQISYTGKKLS